MKAVFHEPQGENGHRSVSCFAVPLDHWRLAPILTDKGAEGSPEEVTSQSREDVAEGSGRDMALPVNLIRETPRCCPKDEPLLKFGGDKVNNVIFTAFEE